MEFIRNHDLAKDLFWGSAGGLAGTLASHSLDTVRIRLQIQDCHNRRYSGIFDWAIKTIRNEGLTGLYKGVTPIAVSQTPVYALVFAGKDFGQKFWNNYTKFNEDNKTLISGAIGGAISTIIGCPAELLKVRSQSNHSSRTKYKDLIDRMMTKEGKMSLYKGYLATLCRDMPTYAIYFGVFDIGSRHFIKDHSNPYKVFFSQIILGILAAVSSTVIPYPFDVLKTLVQNSSRKLTMRKAFKENYWRFGGRFLFKGLLASALYTIPMDATALVVFTQLHELME